MQVLVIGSGGREHALAWKAAQSPLVSQVWVAPGNAGTALEPKVSNVEIAADDIPQLMQFAHRTGIDLTLVGPEIPLSAGIVDIFTEHKLKCFGPTKNAARLETSKKFCKDFLQENGIPTAKYASFSDINQAMHYISQQALPIVIKADGLAAGKGVVIAESLEAAEAAVVDMLERRRFGQAGQRIIVEEYLHGEELSFIAMVDGTHILPLASSQDHKRRDNGDLGPNTGGMGAYSPAPLLTPTLNQKIVTQILQPTVQALSQQHTPYVGFLYAGLMINSTGEPKVLEFNCRLGDPETQAILLRMQGDLIAACLAALEGRLDEANLAWDPRFALGVVLTAGGYPNQYRKGDIIAGLNHNHDDAIKVFHAGTKNYQQQIVTNGGRVLTVTALGDTLLQAKEKAYEKVHSITWSDIYFRHDIGDKGIKNVTKHFNCT